MRHAQIFALAPHIGPCRNMHVSTPTKLGLLILSALVLASLVDIIRPTPTQYFTAGLKRSLKRFLIGSLLLFDDDDYDSDNMYDEYGYVDLSSGQGCARYMQRLSKRFKSLRNRIMSAASEKERRDIEAATRDEEYEIRNGMCMSMIGNSMTNNYSLIYAFSNTERSPFSATIEGHSVRIESANNSFSYRLTPGLLMAKEGSDVGWGWYWLGWSSWGWGSEEEVVVPVITWWGWWKVQADGITVMIKPKEASLMDQFRAYKTGAGQLDIRFPS